MTWPDSPMDVARAAVRGLDLRHPPVWIEVPVSLPPGELGLLLTDMSAPAPSLRVVRVRVRVQDDRLAPEVVGNLADEITIARAEMAARYLLDREAHARPVR